MYKVSRSHPLLSLSLSLSMAIRDLGFLQDRMMYNVLMQKWISWLLNTLKSFGRPFEFQKP
uniref:Uncharacterized protein n=1 Tax=Helianthus annuus TaxID=4232 RepID=A0A251T8P6_HELAN